MGRDGPMWRGVAAEYHQRRRGDPTYKDNWRGAAHNQQQWQCRQRKLTTEKTERDRDQGRQGGCVNPRGV